MSTEIEKTINEYCEGKTVVNGLNKKISEWGKSIKSYIEEHNGDDISTGDFTVHINKRKEDVIDTDKMLEILKRDWASRNGSMQCPYIRTQEYIDFDALEPVIYNEELPTEVLMELNACKSVKVTDVLTYKKVKKEEE